MSELPLAIDGIHTAAAKLAGIAPILRLITDAGSSSEWQDVGNSLEAIAGLSESLNEQLSEIAATLERHVKVGAGDTA